MDDGKILNAEWESGYDQWSIGERIILTTENGSGIMFFENTRTQVAVFRYNPSEIGEYGSSRVGANGTESVRAGER